MAKAKSDHPLNPPGNPVSERGGCKVYWKTYATLDEANAASAWAMVEARIRMDQGYDSGYCAPGSIDKVSDGYEVCFL